MELEQPFRPSQIAQRSEIRQGECEAILVLIPDGPQIEAAEFETQSAAIPVVSSLRRGVLHKP
jgi:hypothetical protein